MRRVASTAILLRVRIGRQPACTAGRARRRPPQPRAAAPIDLTGYWVSLVTEDWRYRMATPPKGDYAGVPLNLAGRQAAAAWDPARATAADERCKPFGAGGIMRMPARLHITWSCRRHPDDRDRRRHADAGCCRSAARVGRAGDWQGISVATWDRSETVMGRGGFFPGAATRGGSLKVVTTSMKPGYLTQERRAIQRATPSSPSISIGSTFPTAIRCSSSSTEIVDPTYLCAAVLDEHAFQEAERRLRLESDAVRLR